ncbi:MAG: hypothetical protein HZC40_13835 [Chloroflexi bacterium]|nr:hypothetical protein [Chloroflexota bacterium]
MKTPRVYSTPTWLWLSVPIVLTRGGGYYFFQTPTDILSSVFFCVE